MTFEQDGFLDEARNIASEQRARYADLFGLARDCSRLAMKITTLLPGATSNAALVASAPFARAVAHFRAPSCWQSKGCPSRR
ncbi:hypothetical protein [Cupriavidus sp. 8B]